MAVSLGHVLGLDRAGLGQAVRLAFAAWLAFAIASVLHVGNACWAAMPIWVVCQSAKGLLLERAFFRIVGTPLGAAAGFGMLLPSVNPMLVLLLLACWVAVNATLVHLLRGVHAYGAMMAGMTAAVVVLPSVVQPEQSAGIAVSRVECTLIGVVVVTLVTGLWTPDSPREDFYRQVRRLLQDTVAFAAAGLNGLPQAEADLREREILQELSEVQETTSLVTAGSLEGYRRLHHVHALVVASLGVMAAARALRGREDHAGPPPVDGADPT